MRTKEGVWPCMYKILSRRISRVFTGWAYDWESAAAFSGARIIRVKNEPWIHVQFIQADIQKSQLACN
jgi:hypothetical protein